MLGRAVGKQTVCRFCIPRVEGTQCVWLRIKEVESRTVEVSSNPKYHKLVAATVKSLSGAKTDEHGFLVPRPGTNSLDARVSSGTLDRALNFLNCVIDVLEAEGFSLTVTGGRHGTIATVFNQAVQFSVVEKMKETGQRQVKDYSWTKTIIDYEPSGKLEFRVGSQSWYTCRTLRDGKKRQLENQIPEAIGAIMREGRDLRIREMRKKRSSGSSEPRSASFSLNRFVYWPRNAAARSIPVIAVRAKKRRSRPWGGFARTRRRWSM